MTPHWGAALQYAARLRGLHNAQQLADALGLGQATVARWYRSATPMYLQGASLRALSETLGMSMDAIGRLEQCVVCTEEPLEALLRRHAPEELPTAAVVAALVTHKVRSKTLQAVLDDLTSVSHAAQSA